jgi:hypothetical protein
MAYAEQLNPLYQQFATRVSSGMRHRQDSTGIYAHAMAAILAASDDELIKGLSLDKIYDISHSREARIHKGNLRSVLEKFEELQVDPDGRGLVLSYNDATREVSFVDRQLLLYRSYSTVKWPWEDPIAEAGAKALGGGRRRLGFGIWKLRRWRRVPLPSASSHDRAGRLKSPWMDHPGVAATGAHPRDPRCPGAGP